MAIADLVVGLVVMPIRCTLELFNTWIFGALAGILFQGVMNSLLGVSVFGIVVISIDRYIATFYPIRHFQSKSKKKAVYVNILTWVIPFCVWMTITVLWDLLEPTDLLTPAKLPRPNYTLSQASNLLICFLRFAGPFPVILVLCIRIYLQVRKSGRRRLVNFVKQASVKSSQRNDKTLRDPCCSDDEILQVSSNSIPVPSISQSISKPITANENQWQKGFDNTNMNAKSEHQCHDQGTGKTSGERGTNLGPRNGKSSSHIGPSRKQPDTNRRQARVDSSSENSKTLRTLAFVVIVFTITWLPNTMTIIFHAVAPDAYKAFNKHFNYSGLARWTSCWNSLINPVAYAMAQPAIRHTIMSTLCMRRL
ncbi:alpha-1A adrenergic receptor-like [Diadema setosum]|uniref:alpha-1A adrenergic receptor-like n=1 Tax=Diadema setosum TaxID=31175 RepID=UPI003B3B9498